MKLSPSFTTVTSFSKILAAVLFVSLPFAGFFLGMEYQKGIAPVILNQFNQQVPIVITPSPVLDPTANWKTYINTSYKYSIKYPLNWTIVVKGDADPSTFYAPYLESPCNYDGGDRCGQINITVEDFNPSKTLDQYFHFSEDNPSPEKMVNKISASIDGEKAISIDWYYLSGDQLPFRTIKAIHKNLVYSITLTESGKDREVIKSTSDWKYNNLYNQILSTFKFLDQNETNSPQYLCETVAGGKWLKEYKECEEVTSRQCSQLLNGEFNKCVSACRHDPRYPKVNCIEVCVPVCQLS